MRPALLAAALLLMALPAQAQPAPRAVCAERFDVAETMMAPPRIIARESFHLERQDQAPAVATPTRQRRARAALPCWLA